MKLTYLGSNQGGVSGKINPDGIENLSKGLESFTEPVRVEYTSDGKPTGQVSEFKVALRSKTGGIKLVSAHEDLDVVEPSVPTTGTEERPIVKKIIKKAQTASQNISLETVVSNFTKYIGLPFLSLRPERPATVLKFKVGDFQFKQSYHFADMIETDAGHVLVTVYDNRHGDLDSLNRFPYNEDTTIIIELGDSIVESPGSILSFNLGALHISIFGILQTEEEVSEADLQAEEAITDIFNAMALETRNFKD